MLNTLRSIFENHQIQESDKGGFIKLHSHTSLEQGLFLQEIFDLVKPKYSLEVGFAYGISTMFILEKHQEYGSVEKSHIAIEPDTYWGNAALYNIEKEGLTKFLSVEYDFSDIVLPKLWREGKKFEFIYIDTTKRFDIVMQDFYFIDKMLNINGVVILDDCGGVWPGIQRVARYINSLNNYKVIGRHSKSKITRKKKIYHSVLSKVLKILPFKEKIYPTIDFHSDIELGLDYSCLAFQKINEDTRDWKYDRKI